MSESAGHKDLERRYRRLLACYPRAFRRANEEEILAVLLACAQDGQQRPGLAASVDLLKGALRARLWPASWPPRTVRAAVRLLCAAAVAQLAVLFITIGTAGGVRSAVAHSHPGPVAQHAVTVTLIIDCVLDSLAVGVWLWRAWRLARGHDRARLRVAVNLTGLSLGILVSIGQDAAIFAPADLIATAVTWLIVLAATLLLFSRTSNRHYRIQARSPIPWRGTSFGAM